MISEAGPKRGCFLQAVHPLLQAPETASPFHILRQGVIELFEFIRVHYHHR